MQLLHTYIYPLKCWCQHHLDKLKLLENNVYRILWDYVIFNGSPQANNRPDTTYTIKARNKTLYIFIVILILIFHTRQGRKETTKYTDLQLAVCVLWLVRCCRYQLQLVVLKSRVNQCMAQWPEALGSISSNCWALSFYCDHSPKKLQHLVQVDIRI